MTPDNSVSDSHCRAKQRGLSEEKWKKEFEILAVESCVLVVVLRSRPVSSTAVMNEDGYESKEEEAVWTREVTPATSSSTSYATRSKFHYLSTSSDFSFSL